jgi:predicted dehydrogenase
MKINRRDFSRLSAMALAASQLPAPAQTAPAARPLGFAPVGLGTISDIFMSACATTQTAKTTGLVTGHPAEKGPKYSALYNVPQGSIYTYETYDKIRDDKAIDAVYIGLPNSMHCEYTVRAAEMGKHVLCEKPMAISSAEARKMIDACKHANVKLMIAYRIQYEPLFAEMKRRINSGEIGKVQSINGGYFGSQRLGAWRLNRALAGGGSLMDLGIYPLNTIRYILGEEPTIVTATASTPDSSDPRFTPQMEETIKWTMKFPSGVTSECASSYGERGPAALTAVGDKGTLTMQPSFNYQGAHLAGQTIAGPVDEPSTGRHPYQFALEAEHFVSCVRNNQQPRTAGEEGLKDVLAMEAIYRTAGTPMA